MWKLKTLSNFEWCSGWNNGVMGSWTTWFLDFDKRGACNRRGGATFGPFFINVVTEITELWVENSLKINCRDVTSIREGRVCREQKESSGMSEFGINTDFLVTIEMLTILSGRDKLQSITQRFFYPCDSYKYLQSAYNLPLTQSSATLVDRNKHKWGNETQNRNFVVVTKLFCNISKFKTLPLIRILCKVNFSFFLIY